MLPHIHRSLLWTSNLLFLVLINRRVGHWVIKIFPWRLPLRTVPPLLVLPHCLKPPHLKFGWDLRFRMGFSPLIFIQELGFSSCRAACAQTAPARSLELYLDPGSWFCFPFRKASETSYDHVFCLILPPPPTRLQVGQAHQNTTVGLAAACNRCCTAGFVTPKYLCRSETIKETFSHVFSISSDFGLIYKRELSLFSVPAS